MTDYLNLPIIDCPYMPSGWVAYDAGGRIIFRGPKGESYSISTKIDLPMHRMERF